MTESQNLNTARARHPGPSGLVAREGLGAALAAEPNQLLARLSPDDYNALLTELRPARLDVRTVLIAANEPIEDVWFVRSGVGSMIARQQEGGGVEVGTIGWEGFVGLPILHGVDRMAYEVIVQVEGDAWRMRADTFRHLIDERPRLRELCLRYAQYFSDQMAQSVACNRLHALEERCAKWLLTTRDRVDSDTFSLTQDFLAIMLGVRRAGVSIAMGVFQRDGSVRYVRGEVTIVDREKLESVACDCYRITREALERAFPT